MLNNAIYDGLFHPSCSYCSLSLKPCSFTDSHTILFLLNAVTAAAAAATAAAADVVVVVAAAVAVAAEFGERPRL